MTCILLTQEIVNAIHKTDIEIVIDLYEDLIWEEAEKLINSGRKDFRTKFCVRYEIDCLLYRGFSVIRIAPNKINESNRHVAALASRYAYLVAEESGLDFKTVVQFIWEYLETQ